MSIIEEKVNNRRIWRVVYGNYLYILFSFPINLKLFYKIITFAGRDAGAAASGGTNAHPTPWRFQGDHSARHHGRWPQEMDLISPSHLAEASLPASAIFSLPEQRLTGGLDWRTWIT